MFEEDRHIADIRSNLIKSFVEVTPAPTPITVLCALYHYWLLRHCRWSCTYNLRIDRRHHFSTLSANPFNLSAIP